MMASMMSTGGVVEIAASRLPPNFSAANTDSGIHGRHRGPAPAADGTGPRDGSLVVDLETLLLLHALAGHTLVLPSLQRRPQASSFFYFPCGSAVRPFPSGVSPPCSRRPNPRASRLIGNYIGAFSQWTAMEREYRCLLFVADLHAITVPQDPRRAPALASWIRRPSASPSASTPNGRPSSSKAKCRTSQVAWMLRAACPIWSELRTHDAVQGQIIQRRDRTRRLGPVPAIPCSWPPTSSSTRRTSSP